MAIRFQACSRRAADPATTNLKPTVITPATLKQGGPYDVTHVPSGRVTIEHAADLVLGDGRLGIGAGYDAASAFGHEAKLAAAGAVAPVTVSVLNSAASGRRVGFVEVRLADQPPVRWEEMRSLAIVTDGGDGGFFAGDAPLAEPGLHGGPSDYGDAFFPNHNSFSGNVCVVRTVEGSPSVDAVLFETGYGDGAYFTYAGRAANGAVVSIVSYGEVLPWRLSGLPGTPPADVISHERKPSPSG